MSEDVVEYLSDNWLTFCDRYKIESIPSNWILAETKTNESKIEFNYASGELHCIRIMGRGRESRRKEKRNSRRLIAREISGS